MAFCKGQIGKIITHNFQVVLNGKVWVQMSSSLFTTCTSFPNTVDAVQLFLFKRVGISET